MKIFESTNVVGTGNRKSIVLVNIKAILDIAGAKNPAIVSMVHAAQVN